MNTMTNSYMSNSLTNNNGEIQAERISHSTLVPLLYLERFSEWSGISQRALLRKLNEGSLPMAVVENRKMVDISRLNKLLIDREEALT